jgi:hypothetical protein
MYSSMMTPVCTETPKRARKPTPGETLTEVRPIHLKGQERRPMGAMATLAMISIDHLERFEHRVKNDEDDEDRHRQHDEQPRVGPLVRAIFTLAVSLAPIPRA